MDLRIARVEVGAARTALEPLARFYGDGMGLQCTRNGPRLTVAVGGAELAFGGRDGAPFHHFALLVPGDRFDAAVAWAAGHATLLARADGGTEFDFAFWDARAVYLHDPAGNIVELIAHRGEAETGATGPFRAAELAGISEIGIVGPGLADAAAALERELGLALWSGDVADDASGLGFVGRKAHTLILAGPGRGWLPTGRPAEIHPTAVTFAGGAQAGELALPGGRVSRVPG
jgi:hypothetical protein